MRKTRLQGSAGQKEEQTAVRGCAECSGTLGWEGSGVVLWMLPMWVPAGLLPCQGDPGPVTQRRYTSLTSLLAGVEAHFQR